MTALTRLAPHWQPGLLALLLLAPFFFWSYGLANQLAASSAEVSSIKFEWEAAIPLLPWTILPYWSIDLFYGLSLLIARNRRELRRQVQRLLSAQLLCVGCFLLWPLQFSTERPAVEGWAGILFDALAGFDLPYNQAPSLHIVLLLILWDFYRQRLSGGWLWFLHIWSLLIGVSVLTTYQHHFIDIPTGLLAGAVCMWAWPLQDAPPWRASSCMAQPHRWLGAVYGGAAAIFAAAAWYAGEMWSRTAWWLWWPAVSCLWVALAYVRLGHAGFQKDAQGRHAAASALLLAPQRLFAWLNARCWTWRWPSSVDIADGVWLGRLPLPWEPDHRRFDRVLDLTAELSVRHPGLHSVPMLDLSPPTAQQLSAAAAHVQALVQTMGPHEKLLVSCALGVSRSAAVVMTWLVTSGRCASLDEAEAWVRSRRPQVVMRPALRAAVAQAIDGLALAGSAA